MTRKATYQELEQCIRELKREADELKRAEKAVTLTVAIIP